MHIRSRSQASHDDLEFEVGNLHGTMTYKEGRLDEELKTNRGLSGDHKMESGEQGD